MPLLSIIIPAFNSFPVLPAAIRSVLSQTFKDYEIWIVDGKSTDGTIELIRSYQLGDKRIHYISEADNGIYDAMNKGIERANGEWLYFLGSDDWLVNNDVLAALTSRVNLADYDFIYGNVSSPEYGENYAGPFDRQKILSQNICHQALFLRKDLFRQLGKFNTRYKLLADYDFNLRCMFNNKIRKKHIDLTIAYYAPAGSSSTVTDEAFIKDKNWLLLKYGFAFFNWRQRIQLCKQILKQVFSR